MNQASDMTKDVRRQNITSSYAICYCKTTLPALQDNDVTVMQI